MAMKPYSEDRFGFRWAESAGSAPIVQNRLMGNTSLSEIWTQNGDFRSPTPHRYTKVYWQGLIGKVYTIAAGNFQSSVSGVQAYSFNWALGMPTGFEGSAEGKALSQAYEKLRGSVDLSVDLVQWRTVLQMTSLHRRLLRSIVGAHRNVGFRVDRIERLKRDLQDKEISKQRARRIARKLDDALNGLAALRLESVYGWAPTMSTIAKLGQQVLLPNEPGMLVCEGKGKVRFTKTVRSNYVDNVVPISHIITVSERAKVKMYFTPQKSVLDNLARISSLNPVSILYEATPFSFVLDWGWAIGGWFRDLETAFLYKNDFVTGYISKSWRAETTAVMEGVRFESWSTPASPWFTTYSLKGEAVKTRFERTTLASVPFPVKPVKQFQLGSERMLNAIALVKATFLKADGLLANRR